MTRGYSSAIRKLKVDFEVLFVHEQWKIVTVRVTRFSRALNVYLDFRI